MSYQIEKLEKNQVKFTFDVAEQDWKDALTTAYNKVKGKYQLEGFRKGHVPMKVLMNTYGIQLFLDDAFDVIFPKYVKAALDEEKDVKPVASPEISIEALSDATLKFSAVFQEAPDVELGQYKDLEFKKISVRVTAKEVDDEIAKAAEKLVTWEPVEDRAAANGDKVIIDYSGSVDGVKFDGGTAEKQELMLGSGMFIPGFEDQVVGMNVGDTKDVNVKFPKEYGAKELADKDAVFVVTLHEIYVKNTPAIDDEFVKDVSETANTLDEYKKEIKEQLKEDKTREAEFKQENEIVETIVKNSKMDVPEIMVSEQADDMVYEFEYRLQYQGLKIEDYYKYTNSTREQLKEQYKETAKKQVETRLVMEAIIKAENIEATDADVEAEIAKHAADANKSVDEYKKTMQNNEVNYIKNQIVTDKLLKFLKDNNKFN